ncbi:MAG TPA: alpha/beta hydrolase [Gaiellaceae bacterium]|nr:alpha/beta hydrolase [Gaiellaceae bacterium]
MRTVDGPGGRKLLVREGGVRGGVPVLIHNGTPGSSVMYEPHLADAETKGIHLISYDRPGYGDSTRNPGRSVADCAADVEAVCDALGLDRICMWGISGGGPHALATAALLPDRVPAAASLASPAPYGADGLDFFAGMGEKNIEEIKVVLESEERHWESLERDRAELLAATPEGLVEAWKTLLGPADLAVTTGRFARYVLDAIRAGIERNLEGWFDDDIVLVTPWGFDLASISVPVLLWQGEQDRFVPFGHGVWLSERIPGVDARLSPDDGHLTLTERRVPEVHDWLLERF